MLKREMLVAAVFVGFLSVGGNLAFSQTLPGAESKAGVVEKSKSMPKPMTTKSAQKSQSISTSGGKTHCSATSGDGKKSCSKSCADGQSASCSNDETTVECSCD